MKQALFFLTVLTICGSLTKAPVMRCGTKIRTVYYNKGNITHIEVDFKQIETTTYAMTEKCMKHPKPVSYRVDSTVYEIY